MMIDRPTTPLNISPQILELCRSINSDAKPNFIPVNSRPEYAEGDCWENVELHIRRSGGEAQHGWMIWENPHLWIEAEFHSVWKCGNGELIDITEKGDGETKILFLPDSKRSPEQGYNKTIYRLLTNDVRWKLWLERNQAMQSLREKYYERVGRRWEIPTQELMTLRQQFGW